MFCNFLPLLFTVVHYVMLVIAVHLRCMVVRLHRFLFIIYYFHMSYHRQEVIYLVFVCLSVCQQLYWLDLLENVTRYVYFWTGKYLL